MINIFKRLIKEFHESVLPEVITRDISIPASEEIITLIGLRRVGKTYMLFQKIKELEKKIGSDRIIFINFEDERLAGLKSHQLDDIFDAYYGLYPENIKKTLYVFFDEVHAAPKWNLFLKRIYEKKKYRIFITGSSSKLLSAELATELRGRTIAIRVHPLSFQEFLKFKGFELGNDIEFSNKRFALKKLFTEFMEFGGYPQVVKYENKLEKESALKSYIELIIYKDIVERYRIRNTLLLKSLINYFVTNISKKISLNSFYESIKKEMSVSKDAVWEYFSYLEDIGFFFVISKFSYSLKKQADSAKKVYIADNGFKRIYGFNFSEETGRLLENLVFVELKRRNNEVFYYSGRNECDFVVKDGTKIKHAIQVCCYLNDKSRKREVAGLAEAMDELKLRKGLILTLDQEEEIKISNKVIKVMPAWKWLLF